MIDRGPLVMDADERVLHELLRDGLVADEERGEPDHRLVALGEEVVEGRRRARVRARALLDGFDVHELGHHPLLRHPTGRRGSPTPGS